jgi:hypothetical protein
VARGVGVGVTAGRSDIVTKKRTTDKQRARELQAHNPRLSLVEALALVRSGRVATVPTCAAARGALKELVADPAVHTSWRERLRGHLVDAADAGWPSPEGCLEFCTDLHAAAGQGPQQEWDRLRVPLTMMDMRLPQVFHAIDAMARAADVKKYQSWFGVQPPEGAQSPWDAAGPWHQAAQRYVFAVALALAGPLRGLLRHPYGEIPLAADVVYGIPPVPGRRSYRSIWTYTSAGLRIHPVTYPRPWGTEAVYGSFAVATASDRALVARALLSHALGGTAPGAQASCSGCQGTGWLEALDDQHIEHRPHYSSSGGPACLCGRCRGSGMRALPVREFAEEYLTPLSPSWSMSRSDIIRWTAAWSAQAVSLEAATCAPGLQTAYVDAVVSGLLQAGLSVDVTDDGYGVDFDTGGHLGAWITLPQHPFPGRDGARGSFMTWSSDRGWCVSARADRSRPASAFMTSALIALCPGALVPSPAELVQALGALDLAQGAATWAQPSEFTVDSYAQVLAYLP